MRWFKLAVVLLALLGIAAFGVQNSTRTTELSFDLGFKAWKLEERAPVPIVIGVGFAIGSLLTAAGALRKRLELSRRVRQLEQELALRGGSAPSAADGESGKGGWG